MSQTGGGCRATNYIGFIRKALNDAGFSQVPVISFSKLEKNPGFNINISMIFKLLKAIIYGDLLQKMLYKNKAYEINKGETQKLFDKWMKKSQQLAIKGNMKEVSDSIYEMVEEFEKIKLDTSIKKPKVGIVGEILIKYHPYGNNFITEILENEGAEIVLPDFMGFVKYVASGKVISNELLKNNNIGAKLSNLFIKIIDLFEIASKKALEGSEKGYLPTCDISN